MSSAYPCWCHPPTGTPTSGTECFWWNTISIQQKRMPLPSTARCSHDVCSMYVRCVSRCAPQLFFSFFDQIFFEVWIVRPLRLDVLHMFRNVIFPLGLRRKQKHKNKILIHTNSDRGASHVSMRKYLYVLPARHNLIGLIHMPKSANMTAV